MRTLFKIFKKTLCLAAILCGGAAMQAQTLVRVKHPGSLEKMAEELALDTCSYISVSGKLNSADIRVLRRLGGYDGDGGKTGRLRLLDLTKVRFVTDKEPFMELDIAQERMAGVIQPSHTYLQEKDIQETLLPSIAARYGSGFRNTWNTSYDEPLFCLETQDCKTVRYKPIFYLGHTLDAPLEVTVPTKTQYESHQNSMPSESVFYAAAGIGDSLWSLICKKGIDNYMGHAMERRADGSCILKVMSRKGQFSPATFYKCRQLRVVALPYKIKFAPDIYDEGNRIAYFIGPFLFRWDRREIPGDVQAKLRRQTGWWDED